MISLYTAMLVLLGFLLAVLLLLILLPAYRRRIERFATDSVRRALPLTEAEIRADKDRLRAEYALNVHRLEMKLEDAAHSAARQSVEINRRDAKVHDLEQAMSAQQMSVEEHENARRVLEQAILDRLPKVEQRLADTRKLLNQRDKEIALLTETSTAQTSALEEATQINVQQTDELYRVRAALETRAARNRETLGDPRFDGEVALRTEIEMLRAKTRDLAAQIERFHWTKGGGVNASSGEPGGASLQTEEIARLTAELSKAEAQLLSLKSSEGTAESGRAAIEARLRAYEAADADHGAEVAKLKAALKIFEDGEKGTLVGGENRWISSKAEISALQAEVDEQRRVIQALRAEIAGSNEKLARQSQHFRDELRRLGSAAPMDGAARRSEADVKRPTLAERIAAPRPPPLTSVAAMPDANGTDGQRETRGGGFLKALNGGGEAASVDASDKPAGGTEPAPRRPRLLERISGSADKT